MELETYTGNSNAMALLEKYVLSSVLMQLMPIYESI